MGLCAHFARRSSPEREVAMLWFRKVVVGAATGAALLAFSFNPGYAQVGPRGATTPSAETSRQLEVLGKVLEIVRSDYVDKPDDEKLVNAAIEGILKSQRTISSTLPSTSSCRLVSALGV